MTSQIVALSLCRGVALYAGPGKKVKITVLLAFKIGNRRWEIELGKDS